MATLDYDRFTLEHRIALACEMAEELRARDERVYALALTITGLLTPTADEDSPHHEAWRLSEVAEEILQDSAQSLRLRDCLQSLNQSIGPQQPDH